VNVQADTETFLTTVDDLGGALQSEEKLETLLSRVEAQARRLVPDLSTETSRGLIRSNAHEVAKSKTAMERAALALTEDWREKTKAVNGLRAVAVARLEALKAEVRAPLTEWEAADKARVARLEAALAAIESTPALTATAADIAAEIARIEAIEVDATWQEYEDGAHRTKAAVLATLAEVLAAKERQETERAELEALRAEKLARDEAARVEAEAKAEDERRLAREKAEADRQAQIVKEREEAVARAAEAAKAAAEREAQEKVAAAERAAQAAKDAAAQAERDREAAAAKAEADRIAAQEKAEAEKSAAVEAERQRAAEAKRQEEAAAAKRAADEKTRAKARAKIYAAVVLIVGKAADVDALTDALMEGRVPHMEFRP